MCIIYAHIHNLPQAPRFLLVALVVAISEEWHAHKFAGNSLGGMLCSFHCSM